MVIKYPTGKAKNKLIQIKMSEEELEKIRFVADSIGLGVAPFVRMASIEKANKNKLEDISQ